MNILCLLTGHDFKFFKDGNIRIPETGDNLSGYCTRCHRYRYSIPYYAGPPCPPPKRKPDFYIQVIRVKGRLLQCTLSHVTELYQTAYLFRVYLKKKTTREDVINEMLKTSKV
jgi:hypothetical protein